MDFREKSKIVRPRSLSTENDYSLTIRKIKHLLKHLKHDTSIFTYKEIRAIREELWKTKKNFMKCLSSSDLENIREIENILDELKTSHPQLCSKESYMSFLKNTLSQDLQESVRVETQKTDPQSSSKLNAIKKIPKLLVIKPNFCEASTSAAPIETPKSSEQKDVKKKTEKPLVESVHSIRSAEGFDENKLSKMQKLYLKALEVREAIDEYEFQRTGIRPEDQKFYN